MMMAIMEKFKTLWEYEAWYASEIGIDINEFHELGYHAIRCDCRTDDCQGFVMTIKMDELTTKAIGHMPGEEA